MSFPTTIRPAVGQTLSNFPGIYEVSPKTWGDFGVKQYVFASRDWLLDNGEAFRQMLTGSTALTPYDPMTLFDDTEKTSAIYGRAKFGFDALGVPELIVVNKADVADEVALARLLQRERNAVVVSAKTGEGIDELLETIDATTYKGKVSVRLGNTNTSDER